MSETTIGSSRRLKNKLLTLSSYPNETYESIIWRLIKGGDKHAKGKTKKR